MPSAIARITAAASLAAAFFHAAPGSADELDIYPIARVAAGSAVHVAPEPSPKAYFAVDATGGVDVYTEGVGDHGSIVWTVEGGYSYDVAGPLHAGTLAGAIAYGNSIAGVRYRPMLLAGVWNGQPAIGVRNSAIGFFLLDTFTIEAGYQLVYSDHQLHHDLRVLAGLNPASLMFYFLAPKRRYVVD